MSRLEDSSIFPFSHPVFPQKAANDWVLDVRIASTRLGGPAVPGLQLSVVHKTDQTFEGSQTITIVRPETVQRQKNKGRKLHNILILLKV